MPSIVVCRVDDSNARYDHPTVGWTLGVLRTANVPVCAYSRDVHVGLVSSSGDATVSARSSRSDGTFVGGVLFLSNLKSFSLDSSHGRLQFRVNPGNLAIVDQLKVEAAISTCIPG